LEIKVFNTVPDTATLPDSVILTGILISKPKSRFVDLIVSIESVTESNMQLSIGNVTFLPVTRSALESARTNLSLTHSIFIIV
jgi:hypothetical protein